MSTSAPTPPAADEATSPAGAPSPAVLLDLLARTFDQSRLVIDAVGADQVGLPTPCPAFDVAALVAHMRFAAERAGGAGRREQLADAPPEPPAVPLERWGADFGAAATTALDAWRAPGAFDGDIVLPFGTFPAVVVAGIYVVEQATHAWDLARAVGVEDRLDQDLAEAVLPLAHSIITPDIRGDEPMPFGAEVAVDAGAPATDRLAGFMGRHPSAA